MSRVANRLRFIEPQLASPVDQPPDSKAWIHEIKYDGYRCQVLLERGKARHIAIPVVSHYPFETLLLGFLLLLAGNLFQVF
jgi:hypothetical protein